MDNTPPKNTALISFLLRVVFTTVFLYAAIASFLDPTAWVGFLPQWRRAIIPGSILLPLFSVYDIALSLWILSGKKVFYGALLAAATLLAIMVTNMGALDIIFRDIAIFFAALALAVLEKPRINLPRTDESHAQI